MRLRVLGCAGSFPSALSPASGYLVEADDEAGRTWRVVLDLGSGALGPLQRHCDPARLDAIGLSHLHPDHVADMSGLYVFLKYNPDGPVGPVPVFGPFGTASRLAAAYGLEPESDMTQQFSFSVWQPGRDVQVGPLGLRCAAVEHPLPAYAVRVTGPSDRVPGERVSLVYSGDTDLCAALVHLARGTDLLLCEAGFAEGRDDDTRGVHLTGRRAGLVAEQAEVASLVLTHVPAWNDPLVTMEEAAEVYGGPIHLAEPDACYLL